MLRESGNVNLSEELTITRHFDMETLFDLYHSMVLDEFNSSRIWVTSLGDYLTNCQIYVDSIGIGELTFKGGQGISFGANIVITVRASYYDDRPDEERIFDCEVEGHLEDIGAVIDSRVIS
jgi:hypothetical protein